MEIRVAEIPVIIQGETLRDMIKDLDVKIEGFTGPMVRCLNRLRATLKDAWNKGIAATETEALWPRIEAGRGRWREIKAGKVSIEIDGIQGTRPDLTGIKGRKKRGRPKKNKNCK